jgi:hypothetical protein
VYAATIVVELGRPIEPEPATSASEGIGKSLGQFAGSFPFSDTVAVPLGVAMSKPDSRIVVVELLLPLLLQPAPNVTNTSAVITVANTFERSI